MKVSHLVVNGCSWTYCQGLDKPKSQGWPALVAEEFRLPIINLAIRGSGNDGIHRRTYEYAIEDKINNNHPLHIIAWTQVWRREAWCKRLYHPKSEHDGYNIVAFPNNTVSNSLEASVLDTWNEEDFYRKYILNRLSLDCLFKANTTPYISAMFDDEYTNHKEVLSYQQRFETTINYIESESNNILKIRDIGDSYPETPCGHYGIAGNIAIADYLIKTIKNRYNSIEVVSDPYLTLGEYLQKTDLNNLDSEWI